MPDVVELVTDLIVRRPIVALIVATAALIYVAMMLTGPRER